MRWCNILLSCTALLIGCSHDITTVMVNRKIEGPKMIALDAPTAPWVAPIEQRLRQKGFKVMHWASQRQVEQGTKERRVESYREASTRYVLVIRGEAYLDMMNRCFGGGFKFDFINAELVDVRTNETIVTYSGSGYSEDCPPASGNIFENISSMVSNVWGTGEGSPGSEPVVIAEPVPVQVEMEKKNTPTKDVYSELMKLDELRKKGILTEEEFQTQKKKVLEGK